MSDAGSAAQRTREGQLSRGETGLAAWTRFFTSPPGQRWVLRALIAYAVVGFVVWIQRAGDFAGYLAAGELVLHGRHLYVGPGTELNTWPPFFSLLCVPLAVLARPTPYLARGIWLGLNFIALWWALHQIARLIHGAQLRWSPREFSLARPEMLLPLLITDRYTSSNFDHLQINILLFALALAGLMAAREGRWLRAGVALGFAASVKVMPIVFLPYLAWRRQWLAALTMAVAGAVFSLSPALLFGPVRFWEYVVAWREKVGAGWGVGKMNQSVWALWDRLLGHGMVPLAVPGVNDVPESGAAVVTGAVMLTLLGLLGIAWWRWRGVGRNDWQVAAEWSVVFACGALFSPVTWKAYLVVLLLPHTLLVAAWMRAEKGSPLRVLLAVTLALAAVTNLLSPGFVGRNWAGRLEMASVPAWIALWTTTVVAYLWPQLGTLARGNGRGAVPGER